MYRRSCGVYSCSLTCRENTLATKHFAESGPLGHVTGRNGRPKERAGLPPVLPGWIRRARRGSPASCRRAVIEQGSLIRVEKVLSRRRTGRTNVLPEPKTVSAVGWQSQTRYSEAASSHCVFTVTVYLRFAPLHESRDECASPVRVPARAPGSGGESLARKLDVSHVTSVNPTRPGGGDRGSCSGSHW